MITFGIVYTPTLQAPTNSPEGEGGLTPVQGSRPLLTSPIGEEPVTPEVGEQAGVVITLVTYHLSLFT